jgi:hypothetical protein
MGSPPPYPGLEEAALWGTSVTLSGSSVRDPETFRQLPELTSSTKSQARTSGLTWGHSVPVGTRT